MSELTLSDIYAEAEVERLRQIEVCKRGGHAMKGPAIPDNATDQQVNAAYRVWKHALANQNQARRMPSTRAQWAMALRVMTSVSNESLINSGLLNIIMAKSAARLPALGTNYESRQMTDQNYIGKYDGLAATQHLLEDEEVTLNDLTTASDKLDPVTIAGAIPMTRRYIKQNAGSAQQQASENLVRAIDIGAENGVVGGESAITGGREKDGLELTLTNSIVGTVDAATQATIKSNLMSAYQNPRTFGALVNEGDFETLQTTPVVAGSDTAMIHQDKDSSTGFSIITSIEDDGMPVAPSAGLSTGVSIFGAWDQLTVYYNEVIDLMFLREGTAGPSGKTILFGFLDYDYNVEDQSAFWVVKP